MKVLKFKTDIESKASVDKVASLLNKEELVSKWAVDIENKDKLLTVSGEEITPDVVARLVREAGFSADLLHVMAIGGHDL